MNVAKALNMSALGVKNSLISCDAIRVQVSSRTQIGPWRSELGTYHTPGWGWLS